MIIEYRKYIDSLGESPYLPRTARVVDAELGRIDVKMEFAENGHLRAVVSAEKSDTLELLQRDARALERALQDAGVKTDSNSLSFQRGQERNAGKEAHEDGSAGRHDAARDDQDALEEGDGPLPRGSIHDGNLDIEV